MYFFSARCFVNSLANRNKKTTKFPLLIRLFLLKTSNKLLGVFFSACVDKATHKKLAFLNDLEKTRISLSEEEKIERVKEFYREKLNISNLEINFVRKIKVDKNLEFNAFVFDFTLNGETQREILFIKDNFLFSDFVNLENLGTHKDKALKILEQENNYNILKTLKEEDSHQLITIGSGNKEVYIFSDPLCPFCKEHLASIDENYLKNHTINFIFISVHGKAGFDRANLIYQNITKATTDSQKLELIKGYYEDNINQEPIFLEKTLELQALFDKYGKMGIKYVPYIIEVK